MILNKAQIRAWADFQDKPIPRGRVKAESVCMWLLGVLMVILLAWETVSRIEGG